MGRYCSKFKGVFPAICIQISRSVMTEENNNKFHHNTFLLTGFSWKEIRRLCKIPNMIY